MPKSVNGLSAERLKELARGGAEEALRRMRARDFRCDRRNLP